MLSMRLEQQLEGIQFNSLICTARAVLPNHFPREPFLGPPPALKLFNTLDQKIVEIIERTQQDQLCVFWVITE
jgi:hypothetical protein